MEDGGWLSTRNKKVTKQPQNRLKKMRSSTLRPMKSSSLEISHSPPPKQLFTATKQSSLNDFFSTHEDPQMEVEVNFDEDSPEQNGQRDDNCTLPHTNIVTEYKEISERKKEDENRCETLCDDSNKKDRTKERKEIGTLDIKLVSEIDKETKGRRDNLKHASITDSCFERNDQLRNRDNGKNVRTMDEIKENLNERTSIKRMRSAEEISVHLDTLVKRPRLDEVFPELVRDAQLNIIENSRSDKTDGVDTHAVNDDTDIGVGSRYKKVIGDIEASMSAFSSQSLDLGSQLSMQSQELELDSLNTMKFNTKNDCLSEGLENTGLDTLQSSQGDSLTFSSQTEHTDTNKQSLDVDSINDDLLLSVDYQNETLDRKYGHILSSESLDLSSQYDSITIGSETNNTVDIPDLLYDGSQHSFSSSISETDSQYQSLDLS